MSEEKEDRLLSDIELADRWGINRHTLIRWRGKGIGPVFVVVGNNTIRYRMSDVVAHENSHAKIGEENE